MYKVYIGYREVMSFDLVRGVNLSEGDEYVGEDARVFQVDGLYSSSERLRDELAMLL